MSCTTCGSNMPCDCGGCVPCNTSSCVDSQARSLSNIDCCRPVVPAAPKPFYNCAPVCEESHLQKITIQQFYASIKVVSSWNVPQCGGSAILDVPGLKAIVIGSYIWAEQFGYFEITAFDAAREQITVVNHCNDGNAAPGTQVPSCTQFTVTDPPASSGQTSNICVAIDFTAPDVGNCLDITLTSVTGVIIGDNVQIGSGFYRVSAIKPNDIITICNDGQGITPGTPVIAKNSAGDYQYCLQVIAVNPCDADAVLSGNAVVCVSGLQKPLKAEGQGWVLTTIDGSLENAAYRPVGSTDCTTLTASFTVNTSSTGPYTISVDDSSSFIVGDVLTVDSAGVYALTITNIPDIAHITGTVSPTPSSTFTIASGTTICVVNCCQVLQAEVNVINTSTIPCASQVTRTVIADTIYNKTITIPSHTFESTVDAAFLSVTAPNSCPSANYLVTAYINVAGLCNHTTGVVMNEAQLCWDSGTIDGRLCWTDFGEDGFASPGSYPASSLHSIWGIITINSGVKPSMYHAGYVVVPTVLAAGATGTLKFYYKVLEGYDNPPLTTSSATFLLGGHYTVERL